MASAGHVWRTTRVNTRRNGARASVSAVLRAEKARALAEGPPGGADFTPRALRIVAFDENVTVHTLPPLLPDELGPFADEHGVCPRCGAPVEEERRRWRSSLGLGLGAARNVDELDGVRGQCRCTAARYPEYGLGAGAADSPFAELEEENDEDDDDDDSGSDDVLAHFAIATRPLFPMQPSDEKKKVRNGKKNGGGKKRVERVESDDPYAKCELESDEDDSSDDDSRQEPLAGVDVPPRRPLKGIPRPKSAGVPSTSHLDGPPPLPPAIGIPRPKSAGVPSLALTADEDEPMGGLPPLPPIPPIPRPKSAGVPSTGVPSTDPPAAADAGLPPLPRGIPRPKSTGLPAGHRLAGSLEALRTTPSLPANGAKAPPGGLSFTPAPKKLEPVPEAVPERDLLVVTEERRSRTLPPPACRPAKQLLGPESARRLSSLSGETDTRSEALGARVALGAVRAEPLPSAKHLSQLTPPAGSPGERPANGVAALEYTLPASAAREDSALSTRSARSGRSGRSTRMSSAADDSLASAVVPPPKYLPRSSRGGSGLSAASAASVASAPVRIGEPADGPARLRFRSRRTRAAAAGPPGGEPPLRVRHPAARKRSFAGFSGPKADAVELEHARGFGPRTSQTALGHFSTAGVPPAPDARDVTVRAAAADRHAALSMPPSGASLSPARAPFGALRGLRGAVARMWRPKRAEAVSPL